MSEAVGLAETDADGRWLGIRRHQIALLVAGLGLAGDALIRSHGAPAELGAGAAAALGAAPCVDGLTVSGAVAITLTYWCRSRWTWVRCAPVRGALQVRARGDVTVRGFQLHHRGRLDLAGHDVALAQSLAALVDGLATSASSRHVSLHVRKTGDEVATLLALPSSVAPSVGWFANDDLVQDLVSSGETSTWLLERWRYVRTSLGVVGVLRISDFSAADGGHALLEHLQLDGGDVTVALHFDVIAQSRARRTAERAVHRFANDATATQAAGFRRTARAVRSLERLAQRETLVAQGRALLRLAVYVSVRAPSSDELAARIERVVRRAHESGLRCQRGTGRQAPWYCAQLPGGPGW